MLPLTSSPDPMEALWPSRTHLPPLLHLHARTIVPPVAGSRNIARDVAVCSNTFIRGGREVSSPHDFWPICNLDGGALGLQHDEIARAVEGSSHSAALHCFPCVRHALCPRVGGMYDV